MKKKIISNKNNKSRDRDPSAWVWMCPNNSLWGQRLLWQV